MSHALSSLLSGSAVGKNFTAEAIEYSSNISAVHGDESCFYELTVSAA
jgi:hypothetical protein